MPLLVQVLGCRGHLRLFLLTALISSAARLASRLTRPLAASLIFRSRLPKTLSEEFASEML